MPVISLQDVGDDPHVRAVGLIESSVHPTEGAYRSIRPPVTFGASPYTLRKHAPRLGEDSERILASLGLPVDDLRQLLPQSGAAEQRELA